MALLCALPTAAAAERLPVTIYTTTQGLANNNVYRILPDSRGFIWFATREGLSRFDGYTFTNYGVDDGLPSAIVNDLIETRDGVYLIATAGGLARLETSRPHTPRAEPGGRRAPLFSVHAISNDPDSRHVLTLYESRGAIWVGTRAGLFQLENAAAEMRFRPVVLDSESDDPAAHGDVSRLYEDRFGTMWVATSSGLRRLWPDGRIDAHFLNFNVHSVLVDRAGHVWAGTRLKGLLELTLDDQSGRLAATRVYSSGDGLPRDWINQLFESADGELWAASAAGLVQVKRTAADQPEIRLFSDAHGLGRGEFQSLALDRSGNLWAATIHAGAIKIARSGFSAFGPSDGIGWGNSLLQTRSGDLCFAGPIPFTWGLYCFNGVSFDPIQLGFRPGAGSLSWGWNQMVLEDHAGDWWFATREGVARFAKAARPAGLQGRSPKAWYGARDGLPAPVILRLFEDSRGDVWIAGVGEGRRNGLSRWQRASGTLRHYSAEPNLPDLNVYFATAFGEDRAGNVWIGFSAGGGIVRYRNGAFDRLDTRGFSRAAVRNIFGDSHGRLWLASYQGLGRVDKPNDDSPSFTLYTTREGLSSNEVTAIVEDPKGRLYMGTGRGVDRLDSATGHVRHFSARDGYTPGEIGSALLDRRTGHLWFAQQSGVSRLISPPDRPPLPPPILITGVEVAARPESLSPLGETSLPRLHIEPNLNHLRMEYVAMGFSPGEDLRYQYRLEGAQNDWSVASNQRTVNFASLAPGAYRFEVRAIGADGVTSLQPASVEFTILPPIWQRGWFLALAAAAIASLLYAIYRYRLRRALEIAGVRTRIASDLHDDIGANLTKIAVLSEVARQHLDGHAEAGDRLSTIARISRESVASMSDVVWAIDPRRDNLRDTIRRMRQHSEEVLAGRGMHLEFHARDDDQNIRIPIDVRRDVFLIFKEALNNAVRHSQGRAIDIDIRADESTLHFRLSDDGVGFDTGADPAGNGLENMRRRAHRLNAALDVRSVSGHGTTVQLSVPISVARRLRRPA